MSRAIRDNLPAVTFAVGAAAIIIASRYLAGGTFRPWAAGHTRNGR